MPDVEALSLSSIVWAPKDPKSFDPVCMKYFFREKDSSLLHDMHLEINLLKGEMRRLKAKIETQDLRFYRETEVLMDNQLRAKIKGLEKQINDLEECEQFLCTF